MLNIFVLCKKSRPVKFSVRFHKTLSRYQQFRFLCVLLLFFNTNSTPHAFTKAFSVIEGPPVHPNELSENPRTELFPVVTANLGVLPAHQSVFASLIPFALPQTGGPSNKQIFRFCKYIHFSLSFLLQ